MSDEVIKFRGTFADQYNHSYHAPKTLRLMNHYCIGRIQEPWTNFTPPIRGGRFRKAEHVSDGIAQASESQQASGVCDLTSQATRIRASPSPPRYTAADDDTSLTPNGSIYNPSKGETYAGDYISDAVQGEIASDVKDFPPLDEDTQRAITLKYQALHERVSKEGFYDCHYTEYGKEVLRYGLLFAIFLFALKSQWFLTSAAFLGLFWVSIAFDPLTGF